LARVSFQGKYGFIDRTGKFIIEPEYDFALSFEDGLAAVEKDGKYGFINTRGELIIGHQFDEAHWFREGLASVQKDGKFGYIDKTGRLIVPFVYDDTFMFSEGLADVEIDENCGYIDGGGTVIIPLKYDVCYRFIEGTAVVEDSDGVSYLINKKGGVLETPTKVDRIHRPEPGIEAFWDDSKSAAGARLDGKIVIEPKFQSLGNFKEGRSIAKVKNRWGVIDDKGKFILPPTYEICSIFTKASPGL
jgi:hypothetical protein